MKTFQPWRDQYILIIHSSSTTYLSSRSSLWPKRHPSTAQNQSTFTHSFTRHPPQFSKWSTTASKSLVNKRRRTATTGTHNNLVVSLNHLPQNLPYNRPYRIAPPSLTWRLPRQISLYAVTIDVLNSGIDWTIIVMLKNALTFIKSYQAHMCKFNAIQLTNWQDMVVENSSHDMMVKVFNQNKQRGPC